MHRVSTKRQSNLEIRTHQRLLPKKVADVVEQPENEQDRPALLKMIEKNTKAYKLAIKFYSDVNYAPLSCLKTIFKDRRKRLDRLAASLRRKEHEFIKIVVRNQKRVEMEDEDEMETETMSDEAQEDVSTPLFLCSRAFSVAKSKNYESLY
uniref:Nucleolar protein 16 n=1 Tax=Caenorhabditis tropicalis TaxID=1561998 RepID=A0A1I7T201_9PELO